MHFRTYIFLFFILTFCLNAQKESYNWYFGNNAGITFAPGSIAKTITDGSLVSEAGCTAISDSLGNILFYSNGNMVWDKTHNVMSNGSGLAGTHNAAQSSIILNHPSNRNIYYLFTINSNTRTLSYSEINLQLNSGLGAVAVKNVTLQTEIENKLSAVQHRNGYFTWLLVHGYGNDLVYAFQINNSGVESTPIITSTSFNHTASAVNANAQMKLSPDGRLLAIANPEDNNIEIFSFDNSGGRVSNRIAISLSNSPYGIEFSPNCKMLYVTSGNLLKQFDLSTLNQSEIENSMTVVLTASNKLYSAQLAPDGKIYIADNSTSSLTVVNSPNEKGNKSNVVANSFSLAGRTVNQGLPAFNQSYNIRLYLPSFITVCEGSDVTLTAYMSHQNSDFFYTWTGPNGFTSADVNPVIQKIRKSMQGYYKLQATLGNLKYKDSTYVKVEPYPKSRIVPDGSTVLCFGDSLSLFAYPDSSQYTYHWSTGETSNRITVKESGRFYLTITSNNECSVTDSIDIEVVPSFNAEIKSEGPRVICEGDSLLLHAYPDDNNFRYYWSTGDTSRSITITKGGTYSVTIEKNRCLRTASIYIINLPKPETKIIPLGPTSFCFGDSVILSAAPLDPDNSIIWSTGETSAQISVKTTGIIYLETVSRNGCTAIDSIEITSGDDLFVEIRSEPSAPYCDSIEIVLFASPAKDLYQYLWSTGDTTPTITINKAGKYSVEVSAQGSCKGTDTINIAFSNKPDASLLQGDYSLICDGDSIELVPKSISDINRYKWSTGETTPTIWVKTAGTFQLVVFNETGCSDTATFNLEIKPKPDADIFLIKSDILCEGDSAMLVVSTNPMNTIKWSTGDSKDTIIITSSGKYYVEVSNNEGCTTHKSIEAVFNPYPPLEIESVQGLTLCDGDTIELRTTHNYNKYLWSTGDTTRSIPVSSAGVYGVLVSDTNNCESYAQIEVTKALNTINGLDDLDFDEIPIFMAGNQNCLFWNYGNDTLIVESIKIKTDPELFKLYIKDTVIIVAPSSSVQGIISFRPDKPGIFEDSIMVIIASPCRDTIYANLIGKGVGSSILGLPDTTGIIGQKGFKIPLRAQINVLNSDIINLSYSAEIRLLADVFLPEIVTNGIIKNDTIIGKYRIITIQDDNIVISTNSSVLTEIIGTVLLGENDKTPIIIENFKWDNPLINAKVTNGSLQAIGACFRDASIIMMTQRMTVSVFPNPADNAVNINIRNAVNDTYHIKIYSANGIKINDYILDIKDDFEFRADLTDCNSGIYYIQITNGIFNSILPLSIIK